MKLLYALILSIVATAACSGGSDEPSIVVDPPDLISIRNGSLIDSVVAGLSYSSSLGDQITQVDGNFEYLDDDPVTFYLGGSVLGTIIGTTVVTPADLAASADLQANHFKAVNIARFLQTLDADNSPANGIQITELMRNQAAQHALDFDQSTEAFVDDSTVQIAVSDITAVRSTGPRMLIDKQTAMDHYEGSLDDLIAELNLRMDELIGTATCSMAADCDAVAIGHRPCGGPGDYRPYSHVITSQPQLEALATEHRQHSRALNVLLQRLSICTVVAKPALGCVAEQCVALP